VNVTLLTPAGTVHGADAVNVSVPEAGVADAGVGAGSTSAEKASVTIASNPAVATSREDRPGTRRIR
jgi:hypothetical protein